MPGPYVVVLGGSAGSIETLVKIVAGLPDAFPAAVGVAIHHSGSTPSSLPHILRRAGPLPAFHAANGERVAPGRIYVAPPDYHLVFGDGETHIVQGPRENGHRPSIDVLFRSAASHYGSLAIAVILSGMLDDGTAGMAAVKSAGGATIAQDPNDAVFPDMPRSAIANAAPDYVLAADAIPAELMRLVTRPHEKISVPHKPHAPTGTGADDASRGPVAPFSCPQCGGTLFEVDEAGLPHRYRCRVGHAYGSESLLNAQCDTLEDALWTALRSLEEQADLTSRIARRARTQSLTRTAERMENRSAGALRLAEVVRTALLVSDDGNGNVSDYDTEIGADVTATTNPTESDPAR